MTTTPTSLAFISLFVPTATNCRGASALPYHLLKFRPQGLPVRLWTFNINGCSADQIAQTAAELGIEVNVLPLPRHFGMLRSRLVRLLLPRPMFTYLGLPREVRRQIADALAAPGAALWIYGEELSRLAVLFPGIPTVVTTPDCEAMYYQRVLSTPAGTTLAGRLRYGLMRRRYSRMAAAFPTGPRIRYHLVGDADAQFLRALNPNVDARFLRHPHYDVWTGARPAPAADSPRLRLLIAGRYDFYMGPAVDSAVEAMRAVSPEARGRYEVTFLGKGWDAPCQALRDASWHASVKGYVDDYAAEVASHHIQLTPVAVGTGTKGKVLDAFANGLAVVGTERALENIAAEPGTECVLYADGAELRQWLERMAADPAMADAMAAAGQQAVLRHHGRQKVADEFFALFG